MAGTTHIYTVTDEAYTNVSNGNLNCALFLLNRERARCHVGGQEPPVDTPECFTAGGTLAHEYDGRRLVLECLNLSTETELWVRAETGSLEVAVVRGDVQIGVA